MVTERLTDADGRRNEGRGKREEGRLLFLFILFFLFSHFSDFFSQWDTEAVRPYASACRTARVHEVLVIELGSFYSLFLFLHRTRSSLVRFRVARVSAKIEGRRIDRQQNLLVGYLFFIFLVSGDCSNEVNLFAGCVMSAAKTGYV